MSAEQNSDTNIAVIGSDCAGALILPTALDDQTFCALVASIEEWFGRRRSIVITSATMTIVQLDGDQSMQIQKGEQDAEPEQ